MKQNESIQRLKQALGSNRHSIELISLSIAVLLSLSWLSDFSSEMLKAVWQNNSAMLNVLSDYSIHLLLSAAILTLAYRTLKRAWEESFAVRSLSLKPRAAICFLSHKTEQSAYDPWEMNMALLHQFPSINYALVITSEGDQGSHRQFETFKQQAQLLYPTIQVESLAQHSQNDGENFTDLPSLIVACKLAYAQIALHQIDDEQVVFDATSGTKECSIAATLSTLKEGRYLHYTDKFKRGSSFDIHE